MTTPDWTQSWTLYPGPSRMPDAAAPDVRARSHSISAEVLLPTASDGGVIVAHGDRTSGYSVRVADGHLVHHYVHGGGLCSTVSSSRIPVGRPVRLEVLVRREGPGGTVTLLVEDLAVGTGRIQSLARGRTGYTGVDVGCDRGLPVGTYDAPARFTGRLASVLIQAADDQHLDPVIAWQVADSAG